jgi:hypothetical protein
MRLPDSMIILVLLAMFSCAATAQPVEPRSLSYGCSGGFTGSGNGVTVRSDGTVLRWTLASFHGPKEEAVIGSDPDAVREIFAQLKRMEFTSIDYNEPRNMSCHISLREGSTTHGVAWGDGDSSIPPQLMELASRLQRLRDQFESK